MTTELTKFNFEITSLENAMQYAKLIADSDLAPPSYKNKPGNVLIAIQYGVEIGLLPLQAIQNIAVINGRPTIWGDAMIALVQNHPLCEYIKEYIKDNTAYCTVKRRGEDEYTYQFSKEDAKQAGLLSKAGVWQQYTNRMLQMRARSFALRDKFSDVLKGIAMREEVEDYQYVDKAAAQNEASNKIKELLEQKPQSELITKIESATTLEDLKEAKQLLKQKHAELTKEMVHEEEKQA